MWSVAWMSLVSESRQPLEVTHGGGGSTMEALVERRWVRLTLSLTAW